MIKKLLLVFILLFSSKIYSQAFLGDWYLHYISIDDTIQYSTIPNSINTILFSENAFQGSICDTGYGGQYNYINDNTIEITDVVSLTGFCNWSYESSAFLDPYLWDFFGLFTQNNIYNYTLNGTDENEIMQLTNANGNYAVYGRSPLPENQLPGIWYLHYLNYNAETINNTFNDSFFIDFQNVPSSFGGVKAEGTAVCNDYTASYNIIDLTKINIVGGIGPTINTCDSTEENDFELLYRNIINISGSGIYNDLYYTVTGNGNEQSLTLTNSNEDYIVYGRQILNTPEFDNLSSLRLFPNPATQSITINANHLLDTEIHYTILSVDGKEIESDKLSNQTINISEFSSGLYFIKLSTENQSKTIKFIKE